MKWLRLQFRIFGRGGACVLLRFCGGLNGLIFEVFPVWEAKHPPHYSNFGDRKKGSPHV